MRVLLDECLPRRLASELLGHDVVTVPEMGWAGKSNGELLDLARGHFDVFLTVDQVDQGVAYQQNLGGAQVAIVVLVARSNRFEALRPMIPRTLNVLATIQQGEVVTVTA